MRPDVLGTGSGACLDQGETHLARSSYDQVQECWEEWSRVSRAAAWTRIGERGWVKEWNESKDSLSNECRNQRVSDAVNAAYRCRCVLLYRTQKGVGLTASRRAKEAQRRLQQLVGGEMRKWTAANGRCEQSRFPAAGWSRNFPLCTKRNPDRQLACQTSSTPVYPPTSIERHLRSCCLQDTELHSATGGSRRRNCDTPKTKIACHFPQPSRQPPQAEEERAASTINHVGLLAARQSHGGHARRRRLSLISPQL